MSSSTSSWSAPGLAPPLSLTSLMRASWPAGEPTSRVKLATSLGAKVSKATMPTFCPLPGSAGGPVGRLAPDTASMPGVGPPG